MKILLLGDNPIAKYALSLLDDHEVLVIADNLRDPSLPYSYKPDVAFSIKYPHVLRKFFIDSVGVPILNFHTAPLPELRGVDTCSWAIVHRLKRFGVTVHIIDEKVDHGDIVLKRTFPIEKDDTAYSLYNKNQLFLKKIIRNNLVKFINKDYTTRSSEVSHFHKKGEFDYTDLTPDPSLSPEEKDIFIRSRYFPGKQICNL